MELELDMRFTYSEFIAILVALDDMGKYRPKTRGQVNELRKKLLDQYEVLAELRGLPPFSKRTVN